jgi:site-specific DNA-methyltransferase (adenine-specific)
MKHLSETFNRDCVEAMKEYPDNYFTLCVVDPPYGIDMDGTIGIGIGKKKGFTRKKEYTKKNWDKEIPSQEYFNELFRVSKNQIVWGANYFTKQLPIIKNYIFWHKKGQSVDDKFNDGEMAFTSLGRTRMVDIWWNGVGVINSKEIKIHPTQKPIALYNWIFANYAKPNDKILDTHLGSQSSRIAAYKAGLDFTGFELDKEYFEQGNKRFNDFLTVYEQEVGKEKVLNGQARLF